MLYQKEVDKNVLKTRSTFGRSTEKFTDLVNAATNKEDDFEDEAQTEYDENIKTGRIIDFPSKEHKSTKDDGSESDNGAGKQKKKPS